MTIDHTLGQTYFEITEQENGDFEIEGAIDPLATRPTLGTAMAYCMEELAHDIAGKREVFLASEYALKA